MTKPIFNSLGSNYNFTFILLALKLLFIPSRKSSLIQLSNFLSKKFKGETYLTYKGRDAIELALRTLNIGEKDEVLTQAFTCHAIEEAITRAGAKPRYVDLEKNELNPSVKTLEKAYKQANHPKALLIQHTLGIPANIIKIAKWCKKKKLILIEDLAQAYGGVNKKDQLLGTNADVVILSFGRDKVLDAISGGACVIKIPHNKIQITESPSKKIIVLDLFYPLLTWIIRKTYPIQIGKGIHWLSQKLNILGSPIQSPTNHTTQLPESHAFLVLFQFNQLNNQLQHRKTIAKKYYEQYKPTSPLNLNLIEQGSNLRFSILVKNPIQFIKQAHLNKIFIADRWYRQAVDSGKLHKSSIYKSKSCPNAEILSKHIVNLPTHINITDEDIERVMKLSLRGPRLGGGRGNLTDST